MPFVLMLAILVVIVWRVLAHNYAERLASKDGIIQLRDAQLADYKDKLNGATPEAAKAKIEALEHEVAALKPRRLTAQQKATLAAALSKVAGAASVQYAVGLSDGASYARDLLEVFHQAGWALQGGTILGVPPTKNGLSLGLNQTAAANAVRGALIDAAIPFDPIWIANAPLGNQWDAGLIVTFLN